MNKKRFWPVLAALTVLLVGASRADEIEYSTQENRSPDAWESSAGSGPVAVYDMEGNAIELGGASASFLPLIKREVRQLRGDIAYLSGVARVVDAEGLERPAWLEMQIGSLGDRVARLERSAANASLDPNGPLNREIKEARSSAISLARGRRQRPPAPSLQAAGAIGGGVEGTVKDAVTGKGLSGFRVTAWTDMGWLVDVRSTRTRADGSYSLSPLQPGTYYIDAEDPASHPAYASVSQPNREVQ